MPRTAGVLALGVALLVIASALAYPLLVPQAEESQPPGSMPIVDPGPDDPPVTTPPDEPPVDEPDPAPTGPYDVTLSVWTREGPYGPEPLAIDRRLFSTNIWMSNGWYNNPDPRWEEMLRLMKPGALRWPAGHPSQEYCFDIDGDGAIPGCTTGGRIPKEQFDAFVQMSRRVGAEPFIGVNVKTASPEMAADLVRYLNVEKGYGVKYWHLGNEPDLGNDPAGLPRINAAWPKFVAAMRAEDPTIKIIGPELMTGATVMGIHNRADWMRAFLAENGERVDGISWHLYPLDSEQKFVGSPAYPAVEHLVQWYAPGWRVSGLSFVDEASAKLRADRDEFAPNAEIWVTELGPDSGAPGARGITDGQVAAVWFADVLGRFGEQGTSAVFQFAYDHWDEDDELSLVNRLDAYNPLPPWYTYWLYAEHWGTKVVRTNSTDDGNVSIHATLREDGKIALVLVNKAFDERDARVTLNGAPKIGAADVYTLTAESPTSTTANVNGVTVTTDDIAGTTGAVQPTEGNASRDSVYTLPPMSVTFVVLTPA